jgi:squalene monooxygenase
MQHENRASDIVVVGGGFAGLVTAAALSDLGADVLVLESLGSEPRAFRGELVHPRGVRELARMRLVDPLIGAGAVRIEGFAAFAPGDSDPVLLPYGDGGLGLAIDHALLLRTLRSEIAERGRVRLVAGVRVQDVLRRGGRVVGVRDEGGREHPATLVVAADGRHSRVRARLGIPATSLLLSHSVAIALPGDVLVQPGHGHVFSGAPGPVLAYPFGERRVRICIDVPRRPPASARVTSSDAADAQPEGARAPEAPLTRERLRTSLEEQYAPRLPDAMRRALRAALERAPPAGAGNHAVSTSICAVAGAALVGDAGGCSHPITATGMTMAVRDAATLASCVREHGLTDRALVAYQRRRFGFVRAREAFTHALYEVLGGSSPGADALCDGMFRWWRGSAAARRASMRVLSGEDDRGLAFAAEYVQVAAWASAVVLRRALRDGEGHRAAVRLRSLFASASANLALAVQKAASAAALERTTELRTIGPRG